MRPVIDRSKRRRAVFTVFASLTVLAACAGENIFSLAAGVGSVGPSVSVTAPAASLVIALGDSVLVKADVNAPAGASVLQVTSSYTTGGSAAFVGFTDAALGSATVVEVSEWLQASVGQVAGSAYIVVQVTDLAGAVAKDSVKVTVN